MNRNHYFKKEFIAKLILNFNVLQFLIALCSWNYPRSSRKTLQASIKVSSYKGLWLVEHPGWCSPEKD